MTYFLGIDLGTTYTAAAIRRDGRSQIVELGNRTPSIPSVVFLTEEGTILTGEAANRRAATEPRRMAREFKRRIGDTTPIMLGGSPYSADALTGMLLRWVVDHVTEREGAPPEHVAVAHPANWGAFKTDLLGQACDVADLDEVTTITEPEAAVLQYAAQERVEPGSVIAVYDLGGGTFDSAVVHKTAAGVEVLGEPQGIERLGGVDFDEAVFHHVVAALGGAFEELDPEDALTQAAVARLRADCVEAKEALSADTEVSIPVMLPNIQTEVRLTRAELEAMIRPPLANSITAMHRAVRSAAIEPDELSAVLLVGGSSRIPLVAQLVGAELGRPVAVDAHPKHAVALGAALAASGEAAVAPAAPVEALAGAVVANAPATPEAIPEPITVTPRPAFDRDDPAPVPPPAVVAGAERSPAPAVAEWVPEVDNARRSPRVAAGLLSLLLIVGLGLAFAVTRGNGDPAAATGDEPAAADATTDDPGEADAATDETDDDTGDPDAGPVNQPTVIAVPTVAPTPVPTATAVPVVGTCDDVVDQPCAEIVAVDIAADGSMQVTWDARNFDGTPVIAGQHGHFFWDSQDPESVGAQAAAPGEWSAQPGPETNRFSLSQRNGSTRLCVRPADPTHAFVEGSEVDCVDLDEADIATLVAAGQ